MLATIIHLGLWLPVASAISGFVVPWITELATKDVASGGLRSVILAFLSAAGGALSIVVSNNGTFALVPTLEAMILSWITAMSVQAHFTNPSVSHTPLLTMRAATAGFGVGGGRPKHAATPPA